MYKMIEVPKEESGFFPMLGKTVEVWCGVYIYHGMLTGVNSDHIELTDASVVYETGELNAKQYKDQQKSGRTIRVMIHAIESWMDGK